MTRVVSLTPLAVDRDSRTFKQAASITRMGLESVLVEGQASRLDRTRLPFTLRTVPTEPRRRAPLPARYVAYLVHLYARDLYVVIRRLWHYGAVTARAVPAASLYYLHSPLQYPAVLLRGLGRTPFVYDAHDFYPAGRTDEPWDRMLTWLERRCVKDAAEVVTVTDGCAELIEQFFGRRPVVIPNMHDRRIDEAPPEGLRTALGLDADAFLVVMVGNAKPGTAVAEALAALVDLPKRVHLAFVGGGWDAYAGYVNERGLGDRVHLRPPVPPAQIAPLIASADAAVILYLPLTPDYLHALPNRFFLPISAGLPLLYPESLEEIRALAGDLELGIGFDPRRPATLTTAIERLLGDDGALQAYRANVRQAAETLNWECVEPQLQALIEMSLNGAGAGR